METKRKVNPGAEKWMFQNIPVLDKGYIKLVEYLGTDQTITDAARVSYNSASDDDSRNLKLISYLMSHRHTSPFEQCVLTFECKMPIFVAREWVRHRTARLNEISGRYSQLAFEVYTPSRERIKGQDKVNKQGSAGELDNTTRSDFLEHHETNVHNTFYDYNWSIEHGIAKEIARIDLPLSTYTKWVWQCDLHNLLHFLQLRMAADAQWEIRQFANAMAMVVKEAFPWTWEAFEVHYLKALRFDGDEVQVLKEIRHILLTLNPSENPPTEAMIKVLDKIASV